MKENADLIQALEEIQEVPARDPAVVQQNRAAFLHQAEQISEKSVSVSPFMRHIGRFANGQPRLQFSTLTIGILVGILLLTFSTGVYAARNSSPSKALYPVKLWLEDSRMAFTRSPHEKLDLRLAYAEERLHEIDGFAGDLSDPALATTLHNFDEQYSAIQTLSGEQELDDVQQERIGKIHQQYKLIYPEEEKGSSDDSDSGEDDADRPNSKEQTDQHNSQNDDSTDDIDLEDTPEAEHEDSSTESSETENGDESPEKTEAPDETPEPDDESDDKEEGSTPEPDPTPDDEKEDSEDD